MAGPPRSTAGLTFFLGTAALTGGCWEAGLTQELRVSCSEPLASRLFLGSGRAGWGTRTQGQGGRPAPRLALAGAHWVGPSSGSLFAVTVLGAGMSDTDRAH